MVSYFEVMILYLAPTKLSPSYNLKTYPSSFLPMAAGRPKLSASTTYGISSKYL